MAGTPFPFTPGVRIDKSKFPSDDMMYVAGEAFILAIVAKRAAKRQGEDTMGILKYYGIDQIIGSEAMCVLAQRIDDAIEPWEELYKKYREENC